MPKNHQQILQQFDAEAKRGGEEAEGRQREGRGSGRLEGTIMGRTTDTFVNDVNTLTAACIAPLNQLVQAAAAFAREKTAYQTLVSQSAARVTALTGGMQWSAGPN